MAYITTQIMTFPEEQIEPNKEDFFNALSFGLVDGISGVRASARRALVKFADYWYV